jgi:hypothetical protein
VRRARHAKSKPSRPSNGENGSGEQPLCADTKPRPTLRIRRSSSVAE